MEEEDRFTDPLTSVSFTVEEAVNRCGFGWFQVKVSIFVGLLWAMNAVLIFLLIVVSPEARCELNLTPLEESLITTAAFSGTLVGSSIWGSLSDRYGRKKCLLINGVCVFLSVLMGCFAFNYSYLVASWALLGFMISGEASVMTFYSEFLPAKQRTISFLFIHVLFVLGIFFVVGAAVLVLTYFKLSWHWLNGVATTVVGLHFFLFLLITESPYYLLTSGKNVEAKSVLERLAKDNKKALPIGRLVLQQETKVSISLDADEEEDYSEDFDVQELIASDPRPSKKRGRFRDLFATSQQTATTVLLSLIWLCSSFGYFGSVLLTTERLDLLDVLHAENKTDGTEWPCGVGAADFRNISSKGQCEVLTMNDYFQFLWTSGAELPGLLITLLLAKYMGRKRLLALELTVSGLSFFLLFICPLNKYLMMFIIFIIRSLITGSLQVVYMYTSEVYPTAIRSLGVGFCNAAGRAGALACPFLAQVLIIQTVRGTEAAFGGLCILAGMCSLFLPVETKNRKLKDNVVPKTDTKEQLTIN